MRRTQLYLEDRVWKKLHVLARQTGTTLSQLVREAVHESYFRSTSGRKEALLAAAGAWKSRTDLGNTRTYIRGLRRDDRLNRILQ